MIPIVALVSFVAALAATLVVGARLHRGAPVDRSVAQLRRAWVLSAVPTAAACLVAAAASPARLPAFIGLREVGGALNAVSRVGALRLVLVATAVAILVASWFIPRLLQAVMLPLMRHLGDLAVAVRSDLRSMLNDRPLAISLLLLIVVGIAARWPLMTLPISYDEAITHVWYASRGPVDVLSDYTTTNNHILHTLAVHISTLVFGDSELAVRLPALLAGTLVIPVGSWLVWARFGRHAAILQAALLAAAPPLVEYSAQARGYTLAALLLLLAVLSLHYAIEHEKQGGWLAFAVFLGLALGTSITVVMGCYFVATWMLLQRGGRRMLPQFAAASLAAGVIAFGLYGPAVVRVGWDRVFSPPEAVALPFAALIRNWVRTLGDVRGCWAGAIPNPGLGIAGLVTACGVAVRGPRGWEGARIVVGLLLTGVVVLIVQRTYPPARTLLPLFPLLSAVVAAGAAAILAYPSRRVPWLVPALALMGASVWIVARDRVVAQAARASIAEGRSPRADNVNRCAEGFIAESDVAVPWIRENTTGSRPVVVHQYSGLSLTLRFYMLRQGVPLTRVHPFSDPDGIRQLDWYDGVYVMSQRDGDRIAPLLEAARALRVSAEAVDESYEARAVETGLRHLSVVELTPRAGRPIATEGVTPRIDLLEYPRTRFGPPRN